MHQNTSIPPAVPIELRGILLEHGELFAAVALGGAQRMIRDVDLSDLCCFENFRRLVLAQTGERCVYLRRRWLLDVLAAAERGGLTVEADDFGRCLRLNDRRLSYAEAGFASSVCLASKLGAA